MIRVMSSEARSKYSNFRCFTEIISMLKSIDQRSKLVNNTGEGGGGGKIVHDIWNFNLRWSQVKKEEEE